MYKRARLLKPVTSKLAGVPRTTVRRVGTHCLAQRHSTDPGAWVLWFGKEYAVVSAVDLVETVKFEDKK